MQPGPESDTYDIIIAGGGTSAGVLAGRLAAADPALALLVLEAGPPTHADRAHTQPARYLAHLRPASTTVRVHTGRASAALGGRAVAVPCGRCVGGGASVNFAMYTRAAASDYDDWGQAGWRARDVLPLLRKCETYQVQPGLDAHGYAGPLKVSYGGLFTEVGRQFLGVARAYDPARTVSEDTNDLATCDAYTRWPKWIDAQRGTRSDVAHHYLYPRVHAPGSRLRLLSGCTVARVLFDGLRASGVEYRPADGPLRVARARRLVVLSAGTFGSPAILERSGIGSAGRLRALGIPPVVGLPGVGENFHDHLVMFAPFRAADDTETLDGIVREDEGELARWTAQWEKDGSGLMAHNGIDAGIKIRPHAAERAAIGPAFARRWKEYYARAPDKPVLVLAPAALYVGADTDAPAKAFSMVYYSMHPAATGRVHIASADPAAPLEFDPAYLTRDEDLVVLTWAYKRAREFARRMPCYRGEHVAGHPAFGAESAARAAADARPVAADAPDIVYGADDERALEEYTRERVGTAWHALGTCAMRAREEGGVVDERLDVYGVVGLKVADMSIAPSNVASNTYSTAVVIGEKAAELVAEELGIAAM